MLPMALSIETLRGLWVVADPEADLVYRGNLPGAFGYDQAAHTLRILRAEGLPIAALLPLALPTSWMVNANATSRSFQAWLRPDGRALWAELEAILPASFAPEDWLALTPAQTTVIEALIGNIVSHGKTNLCAVTKVLALLYPQLVPLMDDAALWFVLAVGEEPTRADNPSASPTQFAPMMDWFCDTCLKHEKELVAIAGAHQVATLDGPQVLDRLLWQHSWGNKDRYKQ
jgi:hypothetical protein